MSKQAPPPSMVDHSESGENDPANDPRRIADRIKVRDAFRPCRIVHLGLYVMNLKACASGAQDHIRLKSVARSAAVQLQRGLHRIAPQATLGVEQLLASKQGQNLVGKVVGALVGEGSAGARKVAHPQDERVIKSRQEKQAERLLYRMLSVSVESHQPSNAVVLSPDQAAHESCALTSVLRVGEQGDSGEVNRKAPVRGTVVDDNDGNRQKATLFQKRTKVIHYSVHPRTCVVGRDQECAGTCGVGFQVVWGLPTQNGRSLKETSPVFFNRPVSTSR